MKYLLFVLLLVAALITAGCVSGGQISNQTPTVLPTPTYDAADAEATADRVNLAIAAVEQTKHVPMPTITQRDATLPPIVGNWSDGTVFIKFGSDGSVEVNGMFYGDEFRAYSMGHRYGTWTDNREYYRAYIDYDSGRFSPGVTESLNEDFRYNPREDTLTSIYKLSEKPNMPLYRVNY